MSIRKLFGFTNRRRPRVTIALLLLISIFPSGSISNAAAQTARESTASPAGGQREGIKVHGHWTIEVRDLDGRVVERREFKNSLVDSNLLVLALYNFNRNFDTTHNYSWFVTLFIGGSTLVLSERQGSLVRFNDADSFRLAGSVKAREAGSVTKVSTGLFRTVGDSIDRLLTFTEANCCPPNPPVSVIVGQTIDVTVVFTFS